MARGLGAASQWNGGSGTEMAPPPEGRRPPATREAGLLAVFAARRARSSSADYLQPSPSPVEPSRTPPSPAELRDAPAAAARARPRERASGPGRGGGAAPGGGGARSPQTARGRGPPGRAPAGAAGRGCAAQGRTRGVDVAPARVPPPPARRLSSLCAEHPAAPDPPAGAHGLNSGSGLQVGISTVQESLCVDRTASLESQPYWSSASAWALALRQLCCLHWSEGAARHGGSHLPGGSHRHRLQRPCRLLAATAVGHSLLGLPFSLC